MTPYITIPWRSTRAPARWVFMLLYVCCAIVAACILIYGPHNASAAGDALSAVAFGTIYCWGFYYSQTLLFAADAHGMRVPGMPRNVGLSLLLHGLLFVVVPAAILAPLGAPVWPSMVLLALCVTGGLLFAWMPQYVASLLALLPAIMLSPNLRLPGPSTPDFLGWAVPVLLGALAIAALRWHSLLFSGRTLEQARGRPMVLQFRRLESGGLGGWFAMDNKNLAQNRWPAWAQACANLRGVGPKAPMRTLRVALGGFYTPMTWWGYLSIALQWGFAIAVFLVVIAATKFRYGSDFVMELFQRLTLPMFSGFAAYATALISVMTIARMTQRWNHVNRELPLMALMPGLGQADEVKRSLLTASLVRPLIAQAAMTALLIASALYLHAEPIVIVAVTVAQLGCAALLPALILRTMGGVPLPGWVLGVGCVVLLLVVNINSLLPWMSRLPTPSHQLYEHAAFYLAAFWLAVIAFLAWLGSSGWKALRSRPHAFIANLG
ncbi:MAG TPA: hypothetical protein VIM98_00450 [Dyella sp.]|uniref:hypothetical protein n=1 Tax=Dyella sp. TaxID=1869338 RepID=UPI002F943608